MGRVAGSVSLFALVAMGQVQLPGTQPSELTLPPEPSSTCRCHESFTADGITEPVDSYKGTMMALSMWDPIFRAALAVAYEDRPELTDLCLRCHAPMGWLSGRSEPGDGSILEPRDFEGVTCDMCHRAVPSDPQLIGSGQYTISANTAKRGPRGAAPFGGHSVIRDDFVSSAENCGICHSLFNPAENAHDPAGTDLGIFYYEQRTYEEWRDSAFPARGETCVDCHMTRTTGAAVDVGDEYDDLAVHNFVGGNHFAVRAVQLLKPELGIAGVSSEVGRWVEDSLRKAAELEITATEPAMLNVESGDEYSVSVRITNNTGHKLPSGYPEGRRVYLEVTMQLDGQAKTYLSGEWDQLSGTIIRDPQIRAYETDHGRVENGTSQRTHHLLLMNQILTDTRIPPEGFAPMDLDMVPAGREFGGAAPYDHWDDHTYRFTAPDVSGTVTGTITVRAMYQSTDGEVVRFLINQTSGRQEATDLQMVWDALGHAPPQEMVVASVPITITEKVTAVDAGVNSPRDASTDFTIRDGGCGCAAGRGSFGSSLLALCFASLLLLRRRP